MTKVTKTSEKELSTISDDKLSRRDFFRKTAAYSVGAIAAANVLSPVELKAADDPLIMNEAPWGTKLGDPVDHNLYGLPSPYEHNNIRRTHSLFSSGDYYASVAMCPIHESEGIVTPNGLFFVRDHGGTAHVDPKEWRLMIHGDQVEREIVLTLDDLKKYPSESRIYFIECPANGAPEWRGPQFNSLQFQKGLMSAAEWTGVMLKTILEDVGLKKDAVWMLAEGSDNASNPRTIPVEKALDDVMVVWGQNGEALRAEQGYPVRLIVPGWEGNLNTKWLRRLEISDKPWHSKEETSKYTMVQPGGKAIRFFWVNEVNSVITSPCPEKPWTHMKKGDMIEVEGIAWTGHGTITGVDISLDGGDNWVEAKLKGLVLPKSWTRFSYVMKWDGKPLLMASRARDDFGNIQPTIDEETSAVGVESVYHRNAIVTWEITEKGECNNVQIRKHKKLSSIILGFGLSALLATSLVASSDMSVDGAVKYPTKDGKYGPYYVNDQKVKYNNGRKATHNEIERWNVDVRPDGTGLPKYDEKLGEPILNENGKPAIAEGSVEWGEELYDAQCAMCHGEFGAGGKGYPTLAGGKTADLVIQRLNPADENPNPDVALKTIGSYWPYASTLWWYIKDSMPFTAPKTLSHSETYAITAFLLYSNGIKVNGEEMDYEFVLNKDNFDQIKMPNENGFYPKVDTKDPHQGPKNIQKLLSDPTIYGKGTRCMSNCIEKQYGKGKTVDDLLLKIKVDLAPTVNQPISVERTWKEPKKEVASGVDPIVAENYATYCSACHANKAIGAPVLGDKAAWAEVLEKGIDEVYDNAINGINAMPPKGTAMNLSDDEFKKIVDYIIDQSK